MKRGENQSTDTKLATILLCNALDVLDSGRVREAKKLIEEAVCLLPEVENSTQRTIEEARYFLAEMRKVF